MQMYGETNALGDVVARCSTAALTGQGMQKNVTDRTRCSAATPWGQRHASSGFINVHRAVNAPPICVRSVITTTSK